MTRRRVVPYLLLNALVSVLVSGTVLFFYDRSNHKTDCGTSVTIPTLPSGSVNADIVSVAGAGALASESVFLQNNGGAAILLTGWTLKDGLGNSYTFPQLTLYPGGAVQVHSRPGIDTAADLFWGLPAPVWKSGELVALYDTQNIARAFFRVP
jgi:Lamin Tail Domain